MSWTTQSFAYGATLQSAAMTALQDDFTAFATALSGAPIILPVALDPSCGFPIASGTTVYTTSGTVADFTGIPSWAKRIYISISAVSLSTSGPGKYLALQLGNSGGIETTGYAGSMYVSGGGTFNHSTYFYIANILGASGGYWNGMVCLALLDSSTNTWAVMSHVAVAGPTSNIGGGTKATSAPLDRVRITTADGSTFDAGAINIIYD